MVKQKIIIFGNCQTYPIYKILQTSLKFNQQYDIELFKHVYLCDKNDAELLHDALKNCDILITQSIIGQHYVELGLDTDTLKQYMPQHALLLQIPVLFFNGYNPEQFYLHTKSGDLVPEYHNKVILYGFINNLSPRKTLKLLNSDVPFVNIKKNIQESLEELKRREISLDVKISDFIEENYQNKRLFWTINHPSNILIEFVSKEILKLLNIEDNIKCEEDFLSEFKTPILNSVKKELKLNFVDKNITEIKRIKNYYKFYAHNTNIVELYKNQAIEFCKNIDIPIKEKLLFGFIPIYKPMKIADGMKYYLLGIPYSSYQNKGTYMVRRTFFQIFKSEKSSLYSNYYFLGIRIWSKKKLKSDNLVKKVETLHNDIQNIHNLLIQQTGPSLYNCQKDDNVVILTPRLISNVKIEKGTYIADHAIITMANIGKFCSIGPNLVCGYGIHPTNGITTSPAFYSTLKQNGMTYSNTDKIIERKEVNIGNDVFIGMNVSILDGITIGNGAVIGAGAVVTKDVPPYAIVGGVPAKIIKYRFTDEIIKKLQKIQWWNWDDAQLRNVEKMFFDVDKFVKEYGE